MDVAAELTLEIPAVAAVEAVAEEFKAAEEEVDK